MVEGAKYMLQLKKEHVEAFSKKIEELAGSAGWGRANEVEGKLQKPQGEGPSGMALADAYLVFQKK